MMTLPADGAKVAHLPRCVDQKFCSKKNFKKFATLPKQKGMAAKSEEFIGNQGKRNLYLRRENRIKEYRE
jgi:hypothetical protein